VTATSVVRRCDWRNLPYAHLSTPPLLDCNDTRSNRDCNTGGQRNTCGRVSDWTSAPEVLMCNDIAHKQKGCHLGRIHDKAGPADSRRCKIVNMMYYKATVRRTRSESSSVAISIRRRVASGLHLSQSP
jgi:hypothetical protein